ncbi:murein L,D-transpeptidase catalytic domain family protein [Fusobacterium necrophorum]|uniref:Murein L,D-transpeptidase catalytic domain family protein n=1 Tax=Fusobacterium necrophorum TaxID=859 RepID=A0A4Q2KUV1_9FUSO|nr:murein L,D-transpeptidase catalytic domain family protein [Fusobacterium necrophorum]RXZ68587.1 murein L,D-transpeptidase catalytic domain family protein [Fusobacterium necrophorum]
MRRIIFLFYCLLFSLPIYGKLYKEEDIKQLYHEIGLERRISYKAFNQGFRGMANIKNRSSNLLTIIDFTKPSSQKRFFVLDIKNKKLILSTYVTHGKGSGGLYATSFSNIEGTHQSSNGFFLTGSSYIGKNGFSLKLYGLEPGRNSNAYNRTLVIHSSKYVTESYIKQNGRAGRSFGCYAVPENVNRRLITLLKNRHVLYVHSSGLSYKSYKTLRKS